MIVKMNNSTNDSLLLNLSYVLVSTADVKLVCIIVASLTIAVAIFGNSIVILSVFAVREVNRTNFMKVKVSLALSDLGYAFSVLLYIIEGFMTYSNPYQPWYISSYKWLWYIQISSNTFFLSVSINSLAIMALQRFYAIKEPIKYMHLSGKKQLNFIIAAWLLGFVYVGFFFLYDKLDSTLKATFGIALFWFYMAIPLTILFVCTTAMLIVFLWNKNRSDINNIGVVYSRRDHKKVVKMTALMVFGYGITCCPYLVSSARFFDEGAYLLNKENSSFQIFGLTMLHFNCIVDIIVYSAFDEHFQTHVKRICCR